MRALICGLGYVGLPLAQAMLARGDVVYGITRSPERTTELQSLGITPLVADITQPETMTRLPGNLDCVVNLVSSSSGGLHDYNRTYVEGTNALIAALSTQAVKRFIQAGSTSVYAQNDGESVDEQSPTDPEAETSKALVAMERNVLTAAREGTVPGMILRISGIYGPGRGHLFRTFLTGEAKISGKPERHLNMAHRDDIVSAFLLAINHGRPGEVYNISDNEPVKQTDFYAWLGKELNRPLPPHDPSEAIRKRGITDKRVLNGKAREALGWELKYPTFREGYREAIAEVA